MTNQYENPNNSNSLAADLSQFDDQFEQAQESDRNKPIPNGKYTVKVDKVELKTARTSGAPMLSWEFEVLGPTCQNRKAFKNSVFSSNATGMSILKSDLTICGLTLGSTPGFSKLSDLPEVLT